MHKYGVLKKGGLDSVFKLISFTCRVPLQGMEQNANYCPERKYGGGKKLHDVLDLYWCSHGSSFKKGFQGLEVD